MLSAAIVGLPQTGKTTVFNLVTHARLAVDRFATGRIDTHRRAAQVPDPRLQWLEERFHPRKVTHAQIEFIDAPGLAPGASQGAGLGNRFLADIRGVDALVHVLAAFEGPAPFLPPVEAAEALELELGFSDLELIERRLERIAQGKRPREHETEAEALRACAHHLESGQRLETLELPAESWQVLSGIQFLTRKPMVYMVNGDEGVLRGEYEGRKALETFAAQRQIPVVAVSAAIESEIDALDEPERSDFLQDLGIRESGIARLARVTYEQLGLISFLTAGPDEVRAWPVPRGIRARAAAGKIHSDIERGFIRAEVVAFADLQRAGNMARAREAGVVRLEGKDYPIADGDVIEFRFNV